MPWKIHKTCYGIKSLNPINLQRAIYWAEKVTETTFWSGIGEEKKMECGEQGKPPGHSQNHWNRQGWGWQSDPELCAHTPPQQTASLMLWKKAFTKIDRNLGGEKNQGRISKEGNVEQVKFTSRKEPLRALIHFVLLMLPLWLRGMILQTTRI